VVAASQTLSLAAKSLSSSRGIEKNICAKKFFESIKYSQKSIQINLFYPLARGKIQPKNSGAKNKNTRAFSTGFPNIKNHGSPIGVYSNIIIPLIIPNTIHQSKRKNL
jgi:hypothetical protein